MLRVSFYYTQIKKVAEAIFFIFCCLLFLLFYMGFMCSGAQTIQPSP